VLTGEITQPFRAAAQPIRNRAAGRKICRISPPKIIEKNRFYRQHFSALFSKKQRRFFFVLYFAKIFLNEK
jgi:hypothetical protein